MSACDDHDPVPCKTPAQLDAEETPRERLDEADARHPAVGWGLAVCAVLLVLGVVRACWGS